MITVLSIAGGFIVTHVRDQDRLSSIENRVTLVEERYVPKETNIKSEEWLRSELGNIEYRIGNLEHLLMRQPEDRRK